MSLRNYANAPATTLNGAINNLATTVVVQSVTGFPVSYPYILIIDRGTASEEVVLVTGGTGPSLTVTRGYDSTTAFSHANGAVAEHGVSAIDPREANAHVNATSSVHGVTGSVVGTSDSQTLTNKIISADNNTLSGLAATSFVLSNGSGNIDGSAAQKVIPAGTVVGTTDTQTLTNKTINAGNNTVNGLPISAVVYTDGTGKLDTLNGSAIPTGSLVGTTATQTLTNKTLTAPSISDPVITGVGGILRAIKTANESVTNSTTLQNDDHLFMTLPAGTWAFQLTLFTQSVTTDTADLKLGFTFSGTSSFDNWGVVAPTLAGTSHSNTAMKVTVNNIGTPISVGCFSASAEIVLVTGVIVVTGSGALTLQWAQDTAGGAGIATTIYQGSWMRAERMA